MTMHIKRGQTLGGVSILEIRRFFRLVAAHHHDSFDKKWLLSELRLSDAAAGRVLAALARQGYVSFELVRGKQAEYRTTELAHELVRSTAAKKISRRTAEECPGGPYVAS